MSTAPDREQAVLGVGLLFRECGCAWDVEPGEEGDAPAWLVGSQWNMQSLDVAVISRMIDEAAAKAQGSTDPSGSIKASGGTEKGDSADSPPAIRKKTQKAPAVDAPVRKSKRAVKQRERFS